MVEKVLIENGHAKTAKAYILYREQHKIIRDVKSFVNSNEIMDGYLQQLDWRVKENSNMAYSLQGLNNHISSIVSSNYWLHKIYPQEIRKAHLSGDFHLHDLQILAAYCCGWEIKDILIKGFGGVPGKVESGPPKHLRTALGQLTNFLYTVQGECSGAQAVSSFDTLLAPFIKYDRLTYKEVKQTIQEFIFNMNVPTRVGFQSPFSNLTLDLTVPRMMKDEQAIVGGKSQKETYGDFQDEMNLINKAFAEVICEGDAKGGVFSFPIPTYNITRETNFDDEVLDGIWKMTCKYGIPYFGNFVNSEMKPDDVRSMCPLAGDEKVLIKSTRGRGFEYSTIRFIYHGTYRRKGDEYEIYSDGKFVKGRFNRFPNQKMLKVTLDNGHSINISEAHLNFVKKSFKSNLEVMQTKKLEKGMYLPYSLNIYEGKGGDKNLGFFVGAFAEDGSFDGDTTVVFSLENERKIGVIKKLISISERYFGANCVGVQNKKTKLYTLRVNSRAAVGLCKDFVSGKEKNKCYKARIFSTNIEFRKGAIEGHYATDGGNRNRIYTSSPSMVETLNMLAATLGTTTSVYTDNRECRLGKEPNYAVLFYQLNRKNYGQFWFKSNNKLWVRIKSIEKISNNAGYCFEVTNGEPIFTVGTTGILTHNCRLRLDNRELRKKGGGLFGANPLTGCYDDKTEILTKSGWKFFKNLSKEDEVFTLTQTNKIELHKPIRFFAYNYVGKMYNFKTKSLDILVTPNHNMVVDEAFSKKRKLIEARDFSPNKHRIPKQSKWEGEKQARFILPSIEFIKYGRQGRTAYTVIRDSLKIKMDDWLRFFGFWIAEGCTDNEKIAKRCGYRVVITQVNYQKRAEIKMVLDNLPFNYREEKNNFVICNKQLWTYLRQFGNKYNKHIPLTIKLLSKDQLKILFDWMVKGDGHVRKSTGQINYWTASKKLADDIQEVVLKLGWLATLTVQKKKIAFIKGKKVKCNPIYIIGVQKAAHYRLREENIKLKSYWGKVYCCEVANHTVFVRRNGKVTWCGNSIAVVTVNMPRLGYLARDESDFISQLRILMVAAKTSLEIKRKAVERFTEQGLYPYSRHYLSKVKQATGSYWGNHFSTIGLIGMNEACLNLLGVNIGERAGKRFALKIFDVMREEISNYQEETGNNYNLEATPGESVCYRLAKLDKGTYPDITTAGEKEPYYTNSTHLPVNYTDNIFEALEHQDELQCKYTGGSVFHGFLGESINDIETCKKLVKRIAYNYRLPYYTLTPSFSICKNHGYLKGEQFKCPTCSEQTEVYSRVVGYIRPVQGWNAGKREEFSQRRKYIAKCE